MPVVPPRIGGLESLVVDDEEIRRIQEADRLAQYDGPGASSVQAPTLAPAKPATKPPPMPAPPAPPPIKEAPMPTASASSSYRPEVEQWRPLIQKYFRPEDVDKALYVIDGESGGNPGIRNSEGSGATGLFQIMPMHGINATDPEASVKWAAAQVANHGWSDWGEGTTYEGKPFGILGLKPYGGASNLDPWESPQQAVAGRSTVNGEPFGAEASSLPPLESLNSASRKIAAPRESDKQFDLSTDPANHKGVGIIGGSLNVAKAATTPIPVLEDVQQAAGDVGSAIGPHLPVVGPALAASNLLGGPDLGRFAAETAVPTTPLDIALTAVPALDKFADASRMAERGFGANIDSLTKADDVAGPALDLFKSRKAVTEVPANAPEALAAAQTAGQVVTPRAVGDTAPLGIRLAGASDEVIDAAPVTAAEGLAARAPDGSPPIPPGGERPATPRRTPAPDLGDSGIKAALAAKEEATIAPGALFGDQGSLQRKIVGVVNPSVDIPQDIHVAYQARQAVQSTLRTELARTELPAYRRVAEAFTAHPPLYKGAADRPLANTWIDYLENPSLYEAADELKAAKEALREAQDAAIAKVRGEYGVDILPFQGADPESVYVPHIESTEALDDAIEKTTRSLSSRSSVTKERAYDSLSDRMARQPGFRPEVDAATLADLHSGSLARMAGNNTFKAGSGGLTKVEVINEVHPGLRDSLVDARDAVTSIKARIQTAMRQGSNAAGRGELAESQIRQINQRMAPLEARVEALGEEYGPELSYLSGQLREARQQVARFEEKSAFAVSRELRADVRLHDLTDELDAAQAQVEDLARSYRTAGTGEYEMSPETYRYHKAPELNAIHSVLKRSFDNAAIDSAIKIGNATRAAALGPDFSPLTIQGGLGMFSHPDVAIGNMVGLAKAAFQSPESLTKALGPDLIRRFEFASNRQIGSLAEEALGDVGPSIPGKPLKKFNDALQRVVDYGTVKAFENDAAILMKMGAVSQNAADHEAANALGKIIPRMNNAETARSVQRVALEGVLPTSRSFTAAPFELAKDYASALAKLPATPFGASLRGREKLALLRGTAMLGSMMSVAVGTALLSAEANGKDPGEAVREVLDPESSRFMSVILGDKGSFSLGGPFRRAFLGVYRATAPLAPGGDPAEQSIPAVLKYGRNTLQPDIGSAYDVAVNRDWRGQPVREGSPFQQLMDTVEHVARGANLLTGGLAQGFEDSGAKGAATELASGLAGVNYFERSPYEQRTKSIETTALPELIKAGVLGQGVTSLKDLGSGEQDAVERWLKENRPDLVKAYEEARRGSDSIYQEKADRRRSIESEYRGEFDALYADLLSGSRTADDVMAGLKSSRDVMRGQLNELYGDEAYQKAVEGLKPNEMRKLEDEWFRITDEVAGGRMTLTSEQWDEVDTRQKEWLQALSDRDPALADRFQKNLALRDSVVDAHPLLKLKREVDDASQSYYDLPEKGPDRDNWLKAHPDANVARWLVYGTSLKSAAAVDAALGRAKLEGAVGAALSDPMLHREVKMDGLKRAINADAQSLEAWNYAGANILKFTSGERAAKYHDQEAQRLYGVPYAKLRDNDKEQVRSNINREIRENDPRLDAWLVWFGYGSEGVLHTLAAKALLDQIKTKYGASRPGPDYVVRIAKDAQ